MAVPEQLGIHIVDTWATADTGFVEINGKKLTFTVGTTSTVAEIATVLANMINGSAASSDESRSALGSEVGEFAGLTAVANGAASGVVVVTGASDGRPISTVTDGETTAGDGSITQPGTYDVTAESPHDWDNVDNWSADTAPVNSDTVVFDHQAVGSCLYNLSKTSLTLANLTVTSGFRHSLGLPEVNKDSTTYPYDEHLTKYLTFSAATVVEIDGSGAGAIKIDTGNSDTTTTVKSSGTRVETNVPVVLLNINNSSADLNVLGGDVGLCFEATTSGSVDTVSCAGSNTATLTIGESVTIVTATSVSGTTVCKSSATNVFVDGGTLTFEQAATITTMYVNGGTFIDMSTGTYTNVFITGGTYDRSKDNRTKTVTNFTIYARCTLKDPTGAITASNGFDIYPALQDLKIDFPKRKTYTLSAI